MLLSRFFLFRTKNTAYVAKKRLQYIFLNNQNHNMYPKYFNNLKKDLCYTIHKYIQVKDNMIDIDINYENINLLVLKLDIVLSNN